jgi:hypothetical protein
VAKPKFKLGDRVKFTRVAQRNMTMLAAENDPKPWWDVKWEPAVPRRITTVPPADLQNPAASQMVYARNGHWSVACGEQHGIYVGTRTKQNGLLVSTDGYENRRRVYRFKRLASVPCGLVVTDVRKSPILVLIEDLEHV